MRRWVLLSRILPHAGIALGVCILAIWVPFWMSCSFGSGACVGSGGTYSASECKSGWSQAECASWDAQGINGYTWIFHAGQSCSDLGYPVQCSDGSYKASGSSC